MINLGSRQNIYTVLCSVHRGVDIFIQQFYKSLNMKH